MGSSLRAFSKMKTIISLIFVLGTVTCHGSYYRSVYSPYYRTRQYSTYRRSYSPLYSPPVVSPSLRTTSNQDDSTHPGTAAALAYINKNFNLDSCGQQSKAYIDSIMAGNSREVASQAATAVYQQNYARGVPLSAACLAAEVAWKNAVARGQDPVLPASLAYMEASPSDSPCYVSGKEYIQASLSGSTPTDANLAATKAFASQISNLASQGVTDIDLTCLESTQAWGASSDIASSASAAAMMAFMQKALQTGYNGYDPVCAAALDAYINAYLGGASEEEANEAAGKAFVSAVDANPDFSMTSHCGKAAQAYMENF